jgi:ABC-2 type transport system ATP-binding protein
MYAIEAAGLTKVYESSFKKNKVQALVDFNLTIETGTIFGLLGPNGAGKTTLIKILLGITHRTAGEAKVLEHPINDFKFKTKVGYLPENHKYPSYLTGEEVLKFFGKLSGVDKISISKKTDELLEMMNMSEWKKAKIKTYSKGMMQRLGLAQAMINDPELIFLDEPTDGVDPIGRKEIRDILLELKSRSKTIFLNSHLLSEVELITDKVAILNKGKMLREGSVKELTEKKEEYRITLDSGSPAAIPDEYLIQNNFMKIGSGVFSLKVADTLELNSTIDQLRSKNILIKEIIPLRTSLEDMFISLIKDSEGTVK